MSTLFQLRDVVYIHRGKGRRQIGTIVATQLPIEGHSEKIRHLVSFHPADDPESELLRWYRPSNLTLLTENPNSDGESTGQPVCDAAATSVS